MNKPRYSKLKRNIDMENYVNNSKVENLFNKMFSKLDTLLKIAELWKSNSNIPPTNAPRR
jgi:hypothetical protein